MSGGPEADDGSQDDLDDSSERWSPGVRTPARLEAFSDGVIAIAATLLILGVDPPQAGQSVRESLFDEWPSLVSFAVSFLVIGVVWVHHHNLFHHVREVDKTLVYLNLGMLLTIAFLPVPTSTIAAHLGRERLEVGEDGPAAALFYSVSVMVVWMWFVLFWNHLINRPYLLFPESRPYSARMRKRALIGLLSYIAAVVVAFFWPAGSLVANAGIVLYFIFRPTVPGMHAARFVGGSDRKTFGRGKK